MEKHRAAGLSERRKSGRSRGLTGGQMTIRKGFWVKILDFVFLSIMGDSWKILRRGKLIGSESVEVILASC